MNVIGAIPDPVRDIEHVWIEMPDGVRLAARLWLPETASSAPVPAIFEYIPYRKGDMVRARDERNHPVFAGSGYACLRVDMRGSGDSEGLKPDMYDPHELSDARHVIDWIAAQPWCDGSVGMFGTSWGGTASLQAALDRPSALKAIIAVCATHDHYDDDIHHMGGLLLTDSIEWGATLPVILASPPASQTVGEQWMQMWMDRLENLTFSLEAWVREEERSPYWQLASVTHQTDRLDCPVLAIGGWSDRYSNSVMSLAAKRPDLVSGIVGAWGHHYPDAGHPGPRMNFQAEALRWWNTWLKGEPGTRAEVTRLRLWLREFDQPADVIDRRNGHWIEVPSSFADVTRIREYHLVPGKLATEAISGDQPICQVPNDLKVGETAGDTGYFGRFGGLPLDQQDDDARSLCFDTAGLQDDLVLLGSPEIVLRVRCDKPLSQVAIRLNDVAPDGTACRIVFALRNLALSDNLEDAAEMVPGAFRTVKVLFPTTAYRVKAGHRIRLSISSSYWPIAWPSPEAGTVELDPGGSRLLLPAMAEAPAMLTDPEFVGVSNDTEAVRPASILSRYCSEQDDGTIVSGWHQPYSSSRISKTGVTFGYETTARHRIHPSDPLSADSRFEHRLRYERTDGIAEVSGWAEVSSTASSFDVTGRVVASWHDKEIFARDWAYSLPRRLS